MQGAQLGLVILLIAAIFAISGSTKKWKVALLILMFCAAGLGIGAGVGWITGSMATGGSLGGVLMLVCGIAASVWQIQNNRKIKTGQPKV